jgi:acyl-CoA-binding protein
MTNTDKEIKTEFERVVAEVNNSSENKSITNDIKLKFYGYYKQATLGECTTQKPGLFDPVGRAKWEAWNKLGKMKKVDAMCGYIELYYKTIQTNNKTKK